MNSRRGDRLKGKTKLVSAAVSEISLPGVIYEYNMGLIFTMIYNTIKMAV